MADILIKGLEIPKKGNIGLLLYSDGSVEICGTGSLSKPLYGVPVEKAIEIPEHGRLIDADEFIKQNKEGFEEPLMQGGDLIGVRRIPMDAVSRAIENAPTILEASDGCN